MQGLYSSSAHPATPSDRRLDHASARPQLRGRAAQCGTIG